MKTKLLKIFLLIISVLISSPNAVGAEINTTPHPPDTESHLRIDFGCDGSGMETPMPFRIGSPITTVLTKPITIQNAMIKLTTDYYEGPLFDGQWHPWDQTALTSDNSLLRNSIPNGASIIKLELKYDVITDAPNLYLLTSPGPVVLDELYRSETNTVEFRATWGKSSDGYRWNDDYEYRAKDGSWKVRGHSDQIFTNGAVYAAMRISAGKLSASVVPPIILTNPDLIKHIGNDTEWLEGITASWGFTETKLIPTLGLITDLTVLNTGSAAKLSWNGSTYDQVGRQTHDYKIEDDDALDPAKPTDTTKTLTSRIITVKTTENLDFQTYLQGTSTVYTNDYWLAASGATADADRQYGVDIKAQTNIPGEYDFVIKKGTTNLSPIPYITNFLPGATTKYSQQLNYTTNSPSSTGESFTSVLLAHGVPDGDLEIQLSPVAPAKIVKIDSQAPNVPSISTPSGVDKWSTITPTTTDNGQSGIDGYYYKFVPAGTAGVTAPSGNDTGWTSVASYAKPTEPGDYDLYVYAKDNATNRSGAKQANVPGEPIVIEPGYTPGEIVVKKTTKQGATVHNKDCPNKESINVSGSCESSCVDGTHKEIAQGSTLEYKLEFENTDTTEAATGSFEDLLPEGIDTNIANKPTFTPGTGVTNVDAVVDNGRWKVTGDYTLAAGTKADITINCKAPLRQSVPATSKVISNQAEISYTIGSGGTATSGTNKSDYANHRINEPANISKSADGGAAIHAIDCPNSTGLEKKADCKSSCVAGNTGLVEEGDVITYKLNFENPSETIQYFATDAASFYDKMPSGVSIAGQEWSVTLSGNGTFSASDTTPVTGKNSVGGTWPDAQGNYLTGLSFDASANGVTQDGTNTLSLAPGAKLEVTVKAKVTSAGSDNFINQVKSGYKLYGNNNATLTTAAQDIVEVNSNYTTNKRTSFGVDTKFTKVGADDLDAPLQGAKFALYKWTGTSAEYATHEEDILDITKLNGGIAGDKWRRATTDGADGTLSDEFTTPASGEIDLGKLPDGIYTLIETQAPVGYELPVGQWILTINNSKGNTGAGDYQIEYMAKGTMLPPATIRTAGASAGDTPTYKVVNVRPFSIGMSGMNGTKGITIVGLAIMLIAGIGYSVYNLKKTKAKRDKK